MPYIRCRTRVDDLRTYGIINRGWGFAALKFGFVSSIT
jgi:hypothetical protein